MQAKSPGVNPLIKVGFVLYVALICLWSLPRAPRDLRVLASPRATPEMRAAVRKPTPYEELLIANDRHVRGGPAGRVLLTTGLWQYWDMFAPNPSVNDFWVTADITTRSGRVIPYEYPRVSQVPILRKYRSERHRKYVERTRLSDFSYAQPYLANYIARQVPFDPGDPPSIVTVYVHEREIQPPGQPQPNHEKRLWFRRAVQPDEVRPR